MPQLHPFTDDDGATFTLQINWDQQEQLKAQFELDILTIDANEAAALIELLGQPPKLTRIVAFLIQPQLRAANLSVEDIRLRLRNEGLTNATNALVGAIADFFPTSRRALFLSFWNATRRVGELVAEQTAKIVEAAPTTETLAFDVIATQVISPKLIEELAETDEPPETTKARIRLELARELGMPLEASSTTSPDASESPPAPSPTANS